MGQRLKMAVTQDGATVFVHLDDDLLKALHTFKLLSDYPHLNPSDASGSDARSSERKGVLAFGAKLTPSSLCHRFNCIAHHLRVFHQALERLGCSALVGCCGCRRAQCAVGVVASLTLSQQVSVVPGVSNLPITSQSGGPVCTTWPGSCHYFACQHPDANAVYAEVAGELQGASKE
ncbi:hypothetical protein QJQ45_007895 [Haematococcus lacustris]|nr:hypothetical protein QJQ45_007895 [Haematococcus lacustris]